jgi:hypothetical protein
MWCRSIIPSFVEIGQVVGVLLLANGQKGRPKLRMVTSASTDTQGEY